MGAWLIALPMEDGQRSCVPDFTKETCSGLHSQDPSCLTLLLSITGSEKSQGLGAVCSDDHFWSDCRGYGDLRSMDHMGDRVPVRCRDALLTPRRLLRSLSVKLFTKRGGDRMSVL